MPDYPQARECEALEPPARWNMRHEKQNKCGMTVDALDYPGGPSK